MNGKKQISRDNKEHQMKYDVIAMSYIIKHVPVDLYSTNRTTTYLLRIYASALPLIKLFNGVGWRNEIPRKIYVFQYSRYVPKKGFALDCLLRHTKGEDFFFWKGS